MTEDETSWYVPERIIDLSADVLSALERMEACKLACREVVTKAIEHWEESVIAENGFWRKIASNYNINLETHRATIDYRDSVVRVYSNEHWDVQKEIEKLQTSANKQAAFNALFDIKAPPRNPGPKS